MAISPVQGLSSTGTGGDLSWASFVAPCDTSADGSGAGHQVITCRSDVHLQVLEVVEPGHSGDGPVLAEVANVYTTSPVQLLACHKNLLIVCNGRTINFYLLRKVGAAVACEL